MHGARDVRCAAVVLPTCTQEPDIWFSSFCIFKWKRTVWSALWFSGTVDGKLVPDPMTSV